MLSVPFRDTGCAGSLTLLRAPAERSCFAGEQTARGRLENADGDHVADAERHRRRAAAHSERAGKARRALRRQELGDRLIERDDRKRRRSLLATLDDSAGPGPGRRKTARKNRQEEEEMQNTHVTR